MKPKERLATIRGRLQTSGKAFVILEVTSGVTTCLTTSAGAGVPIVVIWDWDDCKSSEEVYKPQIIGHAHMPDGLLDFPTSEAEAIKDCCPRCQATAVMLIEQVIHRGHIHIHQFPDGHKIQQIVYPDKGALSHGFIEVKCPSCGFQYEKGLTKAEGFNFELDEVSV